MEINKPIILLVFGIVIIIFAAVIFLPYSDFSQKGQIGDAIGGLTAPLLNLLGAYLVFLSFKTQIEANKIQKSALEEEIKRNKLSSNFNSIFQIFIQLKDLFDNLNHRVGNSDYRGGAGILQTIKVSNSNALGRFLEYTIVTNFLYILMDLHLVTDRLINSDLEQEDKLLLIRMVLSFYHTKVKEPYEKIKSHFSACKYHKYDAVFTLLDTNISIIGTIINNSR